MVERVRRVPRDHPGFLWGAFIDLRESLERLVLLNLVWSLQLVPSLLALAFQEWPLALRGVLLFYSAVAAVPATLVVYVLVARSFEGEDVRPDAVKDAFRQYSRASLRSFAPLLLGVALLIWSSLQPLPFGVAVGVRVLLLLLLMSALYWGPLLAANPRLSPPALLRASSLLVLEHPWPSLKLAAASLLCAAIAAISIGGFFLVSLTLLALFQTRTLLELEA